MNRNKKYVDLGVAIEITGVLRDVCYALARKTAKDVSLTYMLDGSRTPHITLFQGRIPMKNLTDLCEMACEVVAQSNPLPVAMHTKLTVRESGNLFWRAQKTPNLKRLHEKMCEAVGDFTLGHMMEYHAKTLRNPDTPQAKVDVISKYGFSCAGKLFDPHITLARLARPDSRGDRLKAGRMLRAQRLFPKFVVVGRLGDNGDIIEVLNRFELP